MELKFILLLHPYSHHLLYGQNQEGLKKGLKRASLRLSFKGPHYYGIHYKLWWLIILYNFIMIYDFTILWYKRLILTQVVKYVEAKFILTITSISLSLLYSIIERPFKGEPGTTVIVPHPSTPCLMMTNHVTELI